MHVDNNNEDDNDNITKKTPDMWKSLHTSKYKKEPHRTGLEDTHT